MNRRAFLSGLLASSAAVVVAPVVTVAPSSEVIDVLLRQRIKDAEKVLAKRMCEILYGSAGPMGLAALIMDDDLSDQ